MVEIYEKYKTIINELHANWDDNLSDLILSYIFLPNIHDRTIKLINKLLIPKSRHVRIIFSDSHLISIRKYFLFKRDKLEMLTIMLSDHVSDITSWALKYKNIKSECIVYTLDNFDYIISPLVRPLHSFSEYEDYLGNYYNILFSE